MSCRGKALDCSARTLVMGVVNCTPDSFYSGSRYPRAEEAVAAGARMAEEGADILDIGGESSRPGARPISAQEELERVMPVLTGLLATTDLPLSVDTYKSEVAEQALAAGAHMLNDISALRFDASMAEVAAKFEVPVVLMHIKGTPTNMQENPHYADLLGELFHYFEERIEFALHKGIKKENLVIDPGLGFGKRLGDNYEILRRLKELTVFGCPILVGPSRKSFISRVLELSPEDALEGTIAAVTVAILNGANIVRVHDVKAIRRAVQVVDCIANSSELLK